MGGGGEGGGSRLVTFRNIAHLTAVSTMLLPFVCLSFYRSSFFFTFCYSMIANPTERYSFFMNSTEVISIQQKSRSEISDISRAQCKDPTRADPTRATARLVIILASRIQKSVTGDNNFVPNQIFLSDRNEMVRSI